jgi:holo-[acyl-carrier protein] synthase
MTAFDTSRPIQGGQKQSAVIGDRYEFAAPDFRLPAPFSNSPSARRRECCSLIIKMIAGSGIDVIEIARIQHSMDRFGGRFLDRVYLQAEQAYCSRKRNAAESFAARFAAKEAAAKALGTGISFGVNWLEIEVVREPGGKPSLRFHGRAAQIAGHLGVVRAALSLTHTAQLAMASVVLEDGK